MSMNAIPHNLLIALLEWELSAAQARESEWRRRVEKLLNGRDGNFHTFNPRAGALHGLWAYLQEPQDDRRLRQRLQSARYEGALHASPDLRSIIEAMENILIAKSAAIGALRHENNNLMNTYSGS